MENMDLHNGMRNTGNKKQIGYYIICKWVGERAVVHLYHGILYSHKKKEILPFATVWMNLEIIMLSEISQSEKDKCYIIVYVESNEQNKLTDKTETKA